MIKDTAIIKNKWARLIYSAVLAVLAISGVLGGYDGTFGIFMYYTYLSNIIVCVIFAVQTVFCVLEVTGRSTIRIPSSIKGFGALAILFTFLTVFLVLSPFSAPSDWLDARIHYIVPLMAFLEWIIFEPHGTMRFYHPMCWLFTPVAYFAYVLVLAISGIKYGEDDYFPYFFMDVAEYGWGFVMGMLLMLAGVFLVFGYIMFGADKLISKKKTHTHEIPPQSLKKF